MTDVELTVKGAIESLRVRPGDTIVLTADRALSEHVVATLRREAETTFPGHAIAFIPSGIRLSVLSEEGEVS